MAGWFDGLFQGAAESSGRAGREEPRPLWQQILSRGGARRDGGPDYEDGFRQGVHDARAVAAFRRSGPRPAHVWPPSRLGPRSRGSGDGRTPLHWRRDEPT
jgi:hypothetical protein